MAASEEKSTDELLSAPEQGGSKEITTRRQHTSVSKGKRKIEHVNKTRNRNPEMKNKKGADVMMI